MKKPKCLNACINCGGWGTCATLINSIQTLSLELCFSSNQCATASIKVWTETAPDGHPFFLQPIVVETFTFLQHLVVGKWPPAHILSPLIASWLLATIAQFIHFLVHPPPYPFPSTRMPYDLLRKLPKCNFYYCSQWRCCASATLDGPLRAGEKIKVANCTLLNWNF